MAKEIKIAIEKINHFRRELNELLKDQENLAIRANSVLLTLENGLKVVIGMPLEDDGITSGFSPSPIRVVLGDDVTTRDVVSVKDVTPTSADKEALRDEATKAFETFLDRDSRELLESLEDLVIRAVAKKAGMSDVTSTVPERITFEFIDDIKKAIIAKQALEVAKLKGVVSDEEEANDKEKNHAIDLVVVLNKQKVELSGEVFSEEIAEKIKAELQDKSLDEIKIEIGIVDGKVADLCKKVAEKISAPVHPAALAVAAVATPANTASKPATTPKPAPVAQAKQNKRR